VEVVTSKGVGKNPPKQGELTIDKTRDQNRSQGREKTGIRGGSISGEEKNVEKRITGGGKQVSVVGHRQTSRKAKKRNTLVERWGTSQKIKGDQKICRARSFCYAGGGHGGCQKEGG